MATDTTKLSNLCTAYIINNENQRLPDYEGPTFFKGKHGSRDLNL